MLKEMSHLLGEDLSEDDSSEEGEEDRDNAGASP